jgi:hypothetical protein
VLGTFKKIDTAAVRVIKKCVSSRRVRQLTVVCVAIALDTHFRWKVHNYCFVVIQTVYRHVSAYQTQADRILEGNCRFTKCGL